MPEESRNMTACMLATNMGAKKTVARIDNYEYLLPKHKEFFSQLGVHSLIYPEMLAAKDIVDAIKMSWIRQWWEFCGGSLILIGTKMREKAEILKQLGNTRYTLQRSKGLGENTPAMMSETTMHPATRRLVAVTPTDAAATARMFDTLLGDDLPARKAFIALHGKEVLQQIQQRES